MNRRVHLVACGVLAYDLDALLRRLGLHLTTQYLPAGLHATPLTLRARLQEAIDDVSAAGQVDAIAIGYGVCGMGAVGLRARAIPLVIPRVHDCIALFLGSDAAYQEQFSRYPGTYYVSAGWVEGRTEPASQAGAQRPSRTPAGEHFDELVARFGKENSDFIRRFLNSWQRNYQRAVFIDTGPVSGRRRYADVARAMAEEFGWKYEEIAGTQALLVGLLTQTESSREILVVPPGHVTVFDPAERGLKAALAQAGGPAADLGRHAVIVDPGGAPAAEEAPADLGLGIDAGGTYTDVVLHDFRSGATLQTAKALTTQWDFTLGIGSGLDQLDASLLARVDLVSISTTLATNAIVEGQGQEVGLLLMPPYGRFDPSRFLHAPIAVIRGQLEIDGAELEPVDADQVRAIVKDMLRQGVGAFAVAGYASHANPQHELQVKALIREQADITVTCGHDVSEGLNYRIRAETAALNARIIPCLAKLLRDVRLTLGARRIHACTMVVKSDGSLMSLDTALRRPIETILSGPAASVAGARHLAGQPDAIVVDIGGTTTDTAMIRNGEVQTCEDGATVGKWKTHVRALNMRTLGLGGDSVIALNQGQLTIGPRRVVPVCRLVDQCPAAENALEWIQRHADAFKVRTEGLEILAFNGHRHDLKLTEDESRIVAELEGGPLSLAELAERTQGLGWPFLPLGRLETNQVVQRCGLTPTDLLHVTGDVRLWNTGAAERLCLIYSRLTGDGCAELARKGIDRFVRTLAFELLKKQLDEELDADAIEASPAAMAFIDKALQAPAGDVQVRVALRRPVVGIGAPAHCFLPRAAELLGTRAIIPPHADVANAIGAITSSVFIRQRVRISTDETGAYTVIGLPGAPSFKELDAAQAFAVAELTRQVRLSAREAGTRQTRVDIAVDDQVATLADGVELFLGRSIEARVTGQPDARDRRREEG